MLAWRTLVAPCTIYARRAVSNDGSFEEESCAHGVDFTNFCPIRQQLMSNFLCAVRFSSFPGHRSTARGDILAAIPPDAAPTTGGLPERIPPGRQLADLVG